MSHKTSFFNKKDVVIIALILILALALSILFYVTSENSKDVVANIYVGDEVYKSIPLTSIKETEVITIHSKLRVLIEISSEGIRFLESECPDKICVNTGIVDEPRESASCLPARVAVLIE